MLNLKYNRAAKHLTPLKISDQEVSSTLERMGNPDGHMWCEDDATDWLLTKHQMAVLLQNHHSTGVSGAADPSN